MIVNNYYGNDPVEGILNGLNNDWDMILGKLRLQTEVCWNFGRDNKKNPLVFHKPWHNIRLDIVWNFMDVILGIVELRRIINDEWMFIWF
jgi:hypothetical protein